MDKRTFRNYSLLLLFAIATVLFVGCGNVSTGSQMSGNIRYLNDYGVDITGKSFEVVFDVDDVGMSDNGNEVASYSFTWQGGTSQDYVIDISDLPPGNYFVRIFMEFVDGPATWTIYGYYGGEEDQEGHYPRQLLSISGSCIVNFIIEAT